MNSLPIKEIQEGFPLDFREVGIRDVKREGFTYHLIIGDRSINKLLKLDNTII